VWAGEDCFLMKVGRYLVVFLFLMTLLITFGNRGLVDNYLMSKRLAELKSLNDGVMEENNELKKKIVLLRSDLAYIESLARNELGMVKKGDMVYRLSK
jgi:cell division protein FtsB